MTPAHQSAASSAAIYFCISAPLCTGEPVRLSERIRRFFHPGVVYDHRDLQRAAHMKLQRVPAGAILHSHHAGVPDQPGRNSGDYSGCNAACETVEEVSHQPEIPEGE